MSEDREGAVARQAAVMVSRRVGWMVSAHRVDKLRSYLERCGHLEAAQEGDGGLQYTPEAVDAIVGEEWRRRPGWALRGRAVDELFLAIVPAMGKDGGVSIMPLPKRVTWDGHRSEIVAEIPDTVTLYVYPTGEPCGSLTWNGEMQDGMPVYVREDQFLG